MLCNCKNGVSSYEIGRATGIAQKSAWFVLQRCRLILRDVKPVQLDGGTVEADECFLGGKPKNMHLKRRQRIGQNDHKTPIMGMLNRETRQVRAMVILSSQPSLIIANKFCLNEPRANRSGLSSDLIFKFIWWGQKLRHV